MADPVSIRAYRAIAGEPSARLLSIQLPPRARETKG